MIHEILPVGMLQCNCSIFGDEQSRDGIVIAIALVGPLGLKGPACAAPAAALAVSVPLSLALAAGFWSFRGRNRPEVDTIFLIGAIAAVVGLRTRRPLPA